MVGALIQLTITKQSILKLKNVKISALTCSFKRILSLVHKSNDMLKTRTQAAFDSGIDNTNETTFFNISQIYFRLLKKMLPTSDPLLHLL